MSFRRRSPRTWDLPRLILIVALVACGLTLLFPRPAHQEPVLPIESELSISATQSNTSLTPATTPTRLLIPSLALDLPVVSAQVVNGYWQVPAREAAFGLGSAPLGTGNSVIFAHARTGLFAKLPELKVGEKIYVFTSTSWSEFVVTSSLVVPPSDLSVISPTSDPRLTLYTCTGPNDSKRLVIQSKKAS